MTRRRVAPRLRVVAVSAALATGILAAAPVGPVPTAQADTVRNAEYWLADYGVQAAWNTTRGAGVTVAVIDTGVDGSVADLAGVVTGGTDVSGVGSPNGQTPVGDENQHGTMVGSLIAGRGTGANDGVIGVAPEASLLSISVALGTGVVGTDDQIANAVRWAVDNGADVINMSLTRNSLDWPTSWDDAFLYAADHDVVVVAAAGNRGSGTTEVGAPATIPGVLTVAGVDRSGDASFDASSQGITIAVAAPSEQLVGVVPGGGYVRWAGTSGATPHRVWTRRTRSRGASRPRRGRRHQPHRQHCHAQGRSCSRSYLRLRPHQCRGRGHRRRSAGDRESNGIAQRLGCNI
ncbi:S8 family serine peptidase [Agreia bicolorata]|uniref:S8 family serine peptidase n=1 Tax=Agreia bicolorata TaxID=110935 RepID=UPI000B1A8CBF